ncbi:MAG: DJ-1/PfpI family protein [Saprospiraceae bacterium]
MKIAYILFDGITTLDFIGIYDPVSRIQAKKFLPDLSWDLCALQPNIKDGFGLSLKIDQIQPDLSTYDMIIIPGGFGTRPLQTDNNFINWLKTAESVSYKVSICTGSLLLGAAGFLKNKIATTNYKEYGALKKYCKEVCSERIVQDGQVITGGAVASSLDLGLYLCEMLVGKDKTLEIQKSMDYHPSVFKTRKQ